MTKLIGVLALQGGFHKHVEALSRSGSRTKEVRTASDLKGLDGLLIPGGESTAIAKLLVNFGIIDPLLRRINSGMPVFGTCAGMILLSTEISGYDQFHLGCLDISVERNAYGRQLESFESETLISSLGQEPFRTIFIRAPKITRLGKNVEVLGTYKGSEIFVRQDSILAASFHPELTDDLRVHEYFISML